MEFITHFISVAQAKLLRETFDGSSQPVLKSDGNGGAVWVTPEPKPLEPWMERVVSRIEADAVRNEYKNAGNSQDCDISL